MSFPRTDFQYYEHLLNTFSELSSLKKLEFFKSLKETFHYTHWIINKFADLFTTEFCIDDEFTRRVPELLIDMNTGEILGSETISNPFILLNRYEYGMVLINMHKDLLSSGIVAASIYLKMAAKIKGVDDEFALRISLLVRKWAATLKQG